jgi:hypothetical protein
VPDNSRKKDGPLSDNLVKAGYWIAIVYFSIVGLSLTIGAPASVATNMVVFLAMFIIFFFWRYLGLGPRRRDERLAKMATRAMTISWTFTLIVTSFLITLTSTYIDATSIQILGVVILIMTMSFALPNEYYRRKGDVDW